MPTPPRCRFRARCCSRVAASTAASVVTPLLLAAAAAPLFAQGDTEITVIGLVVDRSTQAPVAGVLVEIEETRLRALTDSAGLFRIDGVPAGPKTFVFTQFGYVDTRLKTSPQADEPLRIALRPRPIVLEAIAVNVDRLERRAKSVAYSVRAFERDDIATAAASDPWTFVRQRYGLVEVGCADAFQRCIWWRGRTISPAVYIDEWQAYGGINELMTYPLYDIYRIEVFRRGAMIRVYTKGFMEALAQGDRRLLPIPLWR